MTFAKALTATIAALQPAKPPDLVLLGDVLDLSFGTPKSATASLDIFLKALLQDGGSKNLGKFLIVPGNHDHSLWTAQRQQSFGTESFPVKADEEEVYTTPAFRPAQDQPGSLLIDGLLRAAGYDNATSTYYPNLGLRNQDGSKAIVLHHGHFVESLYHAVSSLASTLSGGKGGLVGTVRDLEKLNGPWIDFFWSSIGESGRAGKEAFLAYDYLLSGGETAHFQTRVAKLLAEWLGNTLPIWKTKPMQDALQIVAHGLVDLVIGRFAQIQRFDYTKTLGDADKAGLLAYLDGPTWRQMLSELGPDNMPRDMTFVFGHTHKPFEDRIASTRFTGSAAVYNIGGWVLDTPMFGTREGASVLFIDDEMNAASLRLFAPPKENGLDPSGNNPIAVRVLTADGMDIETNPMAQALTAAVAANADLWSAFSAAVDACYRDKQTFLIDMLEQRDKSADQRGSVL